MCICMIKTRLKCIIIVVFFMFDSFWADLPDTVGGDVADNTILS